MKLHSLFRQISSHFSPKPPWVNHFHTSATTQERTVHNEVLTILDTINPMEPALEPLLPFLDSRVVTCIIQNQPNPQLGFRFFIWSIQKTRLRSKKSNQLIIDMLYKDNLFDLYLQTLEQVKNSGGLIGSDAFLVLINAYSKLGLPKEAVEAFGKMNDFDCKPDVLAYNAILRVMMRKEVFILALAVYNQMLKANCLPNCSTFCILIDGLCKVGKTKYALELFDEMTSRGILPNRITYTIIASGLCQAKRADDALRLFNKMRAVGCSPDCIAYNALINGFCLLGRLDEAFALLRNFRKDGFVLRVQEYSCMINALFRARRYDEVFAWYRRMFEENVKPDVILYTIMIRGSAEAGMVKEAMDLLNEMAEKGMGWLGRRNKYLVRWKSLDAFLLLLRLMLLLMDFVRPVSVRKLTFCFTRWRSVEILLYFFGYLRVLTVFLIVKACNIWWGNYVSQD
ncbi:PPR domain-containing protein/PPR_1 domain-containing protein/PPR_2 domain-containing protein [Cephalotus follicularis]|uniref:PPR domain-containing protein/PPR_1 domain-containing protein/PPR_2 domain-containing protein n=1 Tax=Cephalotus follicularis TaxID=3775 RepID=A0A1Q3CI37_CEPFO|nr:PPR domain-containing protein/PPR_1 domain-containing protein/PPR_2 domain-containing protein [Cephalotus follicularis]